MNQEAFTMINRLNKGIVQCRGVYSAWAASHSVSYHEMLVLYTIREFGFCTQKQICDSYLLPRQTVNHVISEMKKDGILVTDPEKSTGKEKALVLTPEGERYSEKLLYSLSRMEERAAKRLGEDKIRRMTELFMEYDQILEEALEETDDEE